MSSSASAKASFVGMSSDQRIMLLKGFSMFNLITYLYFLPPLCSSRMALVGSLYNIKASGEDFELKQRL